MEFETDTNTRINPNDFSQTISSMSEGNPGAIVTMLSLMEVAPKIDPESVWGPFGPLILLDSRKIYGSKIYVLKKDVCQGLDEVVIMVLRCCQMGLLAINKLDDAIKSNGEKSLDLPGLRKKIQKELPTFNVGMVILQGD